MDKVKSLKIVFGKFLNYLKRLDKVLVLLCVAACGFSVFIIRNMVQNEISEFATERHYIMQIVVSVVGLAFALAMAAINYKYISKVWFVGAGLGIVLMLLLHTPLGMQTAGSTEVNWLDIGFYAIQPSEFLKISFIISFSTHLAYLVKAGKRMNHPHQLILLLGHAAVPMLLVLSCGDFGSTLIFLMLTFTMLFIAGLWWVYIAGIAVAVPVAWLIMWNYVLKDYHKIRILILIDEEVREAQILDKFDQQNRSLTAIGSGGLTGKGLHGGEYIYIPEFQTDFIFSYIGMTLGFVGCVAVLGLIMLILIRILANCLVAKDPLGKYICIGVFSMFFFNTVINVGMTLAVMPVIGQPLPFISAGGSSVLALFMGIGLVLSVRAHKDKQYNMFYNEKD